MANGCDFLEELETINGLEYDCTHQKYGKQFVCDNCPLGPQAVEQTNQAELLPPKIKRSYYGFNYQWQYEESSR